MSSPRPFVLVALLVLGGAPGLRAQAPEDSASQAALKTVISLKSDLRNLVVAQEAYFADHYRYAAKLEELRWKSSAGNTGKLLVTEERGWSGETRNAALGVQCIIFVNLPAAKQPQTPLNKRTGGEGEPVCDKDP